MWMPCSRSGHSYPFPPPPHALTKLPAVSNTMTGGAAFDFSSGLSVRGRCKTQTLSLASIAALDASPSFHCGGTFGHERSTSNVGTLRLCACKVRAPKNERIKRIPVTLARLIVSPFLFLRLFVANFSYRVALQLLVFAPVFTVPVTVFAATRPVYCAPAAVNAISSPRIFPSVMVVVFPPMASVPENSWKVWLSRSSPCPRRHVPAIFAGTIQSRAVHQLRQLSVTELVSSAFQSPIVNVLETTRVPGLRSRILGRSLKLMSGSRNMVMTLA